MADALRTTYWVPQMGSKFARSACGTKRSARAAARCEIAGVAKQPTAETAPAAAADFKNALRSMMGPLVRLCCCVAGKFRAGMRLCRSKGARRAGGRPRQYGLHSKCTPNCGTEKEVMGTRLPAFLLTEATLVAVSHLVMAGLVPVIPIISALRSPDRDRRDEPGDDGIDRQVEFC